jgi:ribosomal protein S18 acetylase RimI-like enzyme
MSGPSSSDSSPFITTGGELLLSSPGQLELMRGVLDRGLAFRTSVRGLSMTPFIHDKDVVTVAPLASAEPRVGDIVAVVLPQTGRLVIHRVVARKNRGWVVRGDNSLRSDGIVLSKQILGRVVRVERNGRPVRPGVTLGGSLIAALSRSQVLGGARLVTVMSRRSAALAARRAQGLTAYRAVGRSIRPSLGVVIADMRDMEVVQRRLNPTGPYRRIGSDPSVTNLVAKRHGKVIGFVQLVRRPESSSPWDGYWLFSLQVWGLYRGQGVGQALSQQVIELACREGAPELLLAVFEDNDRAIRLYRKLGFEPSVIEALEPEFEAELKRDGRRRIVMRQALQ